MKLTVSTKPSLQPMMLDRVNAPRYLPDLPVEVHEIKGGQDDYDLGLDLLPGEAAVPILVLEEGDPERQHRGWLQAGKDLVMKLKDNVNHTFLRLRSIAADFEPELHRVFLEGTELREEIWELTDRKRLAQIQKPVALVVHGWSSYGPENFMALKERLLLTGAYSEVLSYSYPTTRESITQNADRLYKRLAQEGFLQIQPELDIFAHSQGGLLCRSLLLDGPKDLSGRVRNLVMAGTPHYGTPAAIWGDAVFDLVAGLWAARGALSGKLLKAVGTLLSARRHDPGLQDMIPTPQPSPFLLNLNRFQPPTTLGVRRGIFVAATHLPPEEINWYHRKVFGNVLHDGVVPTESAADIPFCNFARIEVAVGDHGSYYEDPVTAETIVGRVLKDVPVQR